MINKGLLILSDAKASQWCYVDTDNRFIFMDNTFIIDESVEEYKVHNKAGEVDNFTNETYMEEVLVVLSKDGELKFYNQNFDLIDDNKIIVERNRSS